MSEVPLSAYVTRPVLGLGDLVIHDGTKYIITPEFAPGMVMWDRQQAESRFVHGAVTTSRRKQQSEFTIGIDVLAPTFSLLTLRMHELVEAFEQDTFIFDMTFEGSQYRWQCEAADYVIAWEHERIHNRRLMITFSFPRHPIPLLGV